MDHQGLGTKQINNETQANNSWEHMPPPTGTAYSFIQLRDCLILFQYQEVQTIFIKVFITINNVPYFVLLYIIIK